MGTHRRTRRKILRTRARARAHGPGAVGRAGRRGRGRVGDVGALRSGRLRGGLGRGAWKCSRQGVVLSGERLGSRAASPARCGGSGQDGKRCGVFARCGSRGLPERDRGDGDEAAGGGRQALVGGVCAPPPEGGGGGGGRAGGGGPRRAEAGGHARDKQFQIRGGIERVGGGGELRQPPPVEPPGRPVRFGLVSRGSALPLKTFEGMNRFG